VKEPPSVAPRALGALLTEFSKDPIGFVTRAATLGDVVAIPFPAMTSYLLIHPDQIRQVLIERVRSYGKQTWSHRLMRVFLGQGLLTAEGATWRKHRRAMQPAFHRQALGGFAAIIQEEADGLASRLEAHHGEVVELHGELVRTTLRAIGRCLLGVDLSDTSDEIGAALTSGLELGMRALLNPYPGPRMWDTKAGLTEVLARLDRVVFPLIDARRKHPGDHRDLLTMLIAARDPESGEPLSDYDLRDEVMTILIAGHETTANALAFTLDLLSRHPAHAERLKSEAAAAGPSREPEDLPFTSACFAESLRLYPPVWLITRSVDQDEEIAGFPIERGSELMLAPWCTHRDGRWFPDPLRFDPQRFLDRPDGGAPACAYLPFGAGMRTCIGAELAAMEARIILTAILGRVALAPTREPPALVGGLSLRPAGGVHLSVDARA
jgi:cytochrome P450